LFQALRIWLDRLRALRDLRSVEDRHGIDFRPHFVIQIDLAQRALKQGDRAQAVEIWRQLRARFPGLSAMSEDGLSLALDLGYYDEAEAMLRAGQRYQPDRKALFAMGLVRVAYRRGDLEEAVRRCMTLLRKFPAMADGYHIAATCLSDLGRHEEADAMLERGVSNLPADFSLNARYARQAMHRRAWSEALRRWGLMRGRFENPAVPLGSAECLREMGHLAEAEEMLTETGARCGESTGLLAELANLASAKGDFSEAVRCWKNAVSLVPSFAIGYTKGAEAMRKIGREAEADELLCVAVARLKTNLAVNLEYARSAQRRHDWVAATERWKLVRDRFPDCAEARQQEAKALAASVKQRSSSCHRGGVPV
jgi:tetratricopeptide (TPR) repeat protein